MRISCDKKVRYSLPLITFVTNTASIKVTPEFRYPHKIENYYVSGLLQNRIKGRKVFNKYFEPIKPKYVQEIKLNDFTDDVEKVINKVDAKTATYGIEGLAEEVGNGVFIHTGTELARLGTAALGVPLYLPSPNPDATIKSFIAENIKLIEKLDKDLTSDLETLILRSARAGTRAGTLSKQISHIFKLDRNRARLIARDQTAKLTGQFTKERQQYVGIKAYIWRTAKDERVRPTHSSKEGQRYFWSRPPAETGHPGQDYQCRCYAEADWRYLLKSI